LHHDALLQKFSSREDAGGNRFRAEFSRHTETVTRMNVPCKNTARIEANSPTAHPDMPLQSASLHHPRLLTSPAKSWLSMAAIFCKRTKARKIPLPRLLESPR
jgi:hypothetical protein